MLPQHHVVISLLVAAAVQAGALAAHSVRPRAMEACSGASAAVTALATLLARGTYFPRQVAASSLLACWGARLSVHLARRDVESRLPARRLCVTRTLWAALVALPVVAVNTLQAEPKPAGSLELAGAAAALLGLALEAVADAQKTAWHEAHPQRPGSGDAEPPVCAAGAWAWSRHPNLFGEMLFHAGLYALVARVTPAVVAASPVATVLTVAWLPTGPLKTLEREKFSLFAGYPAYLKYVARTSLLLPVPPGAYAASRAACPHFCEQACGV